MDIPPRDIKLFLDFYTQDCIDELFLESNRRGLDFINLQVFDAKDNFNVIKKNDEKSYDISQDPKHPNMARSYPCYKYFTHPNVLKYMSTNLVFKNYTYKVVEVGNCSFCARLYTKI